MKEKFFAIDLMPFLYRGHFAFLSNPRTTASGVNTSALFGFANGLLSIMKKERPAYACIAADPGGPTFRHEAYPAYKAQRQKMPEDIADSIPRALELAAALRIPVLRHEGFEADDVLGTVAAKAAAAGFEVCVATPDKDAAQLVRPGVSLYRPGRAGDAAEIYGEREVCERWGLSSPSQMIDWLALAGDASDNIPGVRGVGEKTATALLSQFGSLEGVLANVTSIKGKLAEKVAASVDDARLSKFLATIRTDVPVEPDWEACRVREPDAARLAAFCEMYELNRVASGFGVALSGATAPSAGSAAADGGEDAPTDAAVAPATALATIENTPHDYRLVETEDEAQALAAELAKAPLVAFDTETAPADDAPATDARRCRLVGVSFATAPGKAWYVTADQIDAFRDVFADPAKVFVAHNAKFDRTVLRRYGIGFASTPRDTMLEHYCLDAAARHSLDALAEKRLGYRPIPIEALIGEKERGKEQRSMSALSPAEIRDYAAEDADIALRLDAVLRPEVEKAGSLRCLEEIEEPLSRILADMEREGVKIDVAALREYGRELDRDLLGLTQEIHAFGGPGFNPDSPKQLGELLFGRLGLQGGRRTASGRFSTDEKTLSKLAGEHPVVAKILEYRACAKLKSTYVDKLPGLIDAEGRVHTTYSQCLTETGRLSSSDPNLQNIPVRTERGRPIRRAFVARDGGHVLVSADYSQIELRLMAAFSKDEAMLEAFRSGADIHRETAGRVFGVAPEDATPEQRSQCKMVNFGIIYGISAFGLSQRLKIPRRDAADLIETYFKTYPGVKAYMERAVAEARERGYATTFLGRRRTLRDISSRNATARQAAERDAINTPIQGSAADLVKAAMVKIDRALRFEGLAAKMVLQIHDELVFDAPVGEAERVMELARREMAGALDFGVPLEVGVGCGANWLEAH